MYLVTGATGNVGAEVARALADAGERVRALSRTASTAVAGADVVAADLDDPTSLRAALTGIRGVFLLPGFSDMDAVMAEIQRAGVEHVVLLSGASAATGNTGNAIAAYMIRSEQALRRSALNWTILRPSAFMSNALRWVPQLRASDTVREPFAHIAAAVIDPADIAAVAADALHAPEGHRHAVHPLTGPHALTPARRLAILAETLGRDLRLEPLSNDDARSQLERDMPAAYVDAFFDFYVDGTLDESTIHPTVETILGRPPRTFEQWARDHKEAFR